MEKRKAELKMENPQLKLAQCLNGEKLEDIPLDFLNSNLFGDKYRFLKVLGAGAFGVVVAAEERGNGEKCAVKILPRSHFQESLLKSALYEANLMAGLNHPNIIKLKQVHECTTHTLIVMELGLKGSLQTFMTLKATEQTTVTEIEARVIVRQIIEALNFLHNRHIVHRDISPKNILLQSFVNLEGAVRIADFGLAEKLTDFNKYTSTVYCGTRSFMAPEQLQGSSYNSKVDIWATGLIMFKLLSGRHPFRKNGVYISQYNESTRPLHSTKSFSVLAEDFFFRLCKINPSERYSTVEALKHPWITEKIEDPIPICYLEYIRMKCVKKQFGNVIMLCIFLSQFQKKTPNNSDLFIELLSDEEVLKIRKRLIFRRRKKKIFSPTSISNSGLVLSAKHQLHSKSRTPKDFFLTHESQILRNPSVSSTRSLGSTHTVIDFSSFYQVNQSPASSPDLGPSRKPTKSKKRWKLSKFAPKNFQTLYQELPTPPPKYNQLPPIPPRKKPLSFHAK